MEIAKLAGLEQSLDVLADQLKEAKFDKPTNDTPFIAACYEPLWFEFPVLDDPKRDWMLSKYGNFINELSHKVATMAAEQFPGIFIHPKMDQTIAGAVLTACSRILSNEMPYRSVFERKNGVMVKILYAVMPREDKSPALMLDVRTEEWHVVRRAGKEEEFVSNGFLERITQPKDKK